MLVQEICSGFFFGFWMSYISALTWNVSVCINIQTLTSGFGLHDLEKKWWCLLKKNFYSSYGSWPKMDLGSPSVRIPHDKRGNNLLFYCKNKSQSSRLHFFLRAHRQKVGKSLFLVWIWEFYVDAICWIFSSSWTWKGLQQPHIPFWADLVSAVLCDCGAQKQTQ